MASFDWMLREAGIGALAFLLAILTVGLGRYIYTHRMALTIEQKEARHAAIGLAIVFGGLAIRAFELWTESLALRTGLPHVPWAGSNTVFVGVLALTVFGVLLTVRAFHPWPLWAAMLAVSLVIPVAGVLLL